VAGLLQCAMAAEESKDAEQTTEIPAEETTEVVVAKEQEEHAAEPPPEETKAEEMVEEAANTEPKEPEAPQQAEAGETQEEAKTEPVEAKEAKEPEDDSPDDERPRLQERVIVSKMDATLNAVTSSGGKVLVALSDGGLQHLTAAARATVGISAGRYLFEARIVESKNPMDSSLKQNRSAPRQLCSLGFTLAGSPLFLGSNTESVGFDSEGCFLSGTSRSRIFDRWVPCQQVFGVLLNLDATSSSANTVSLFCDGVRVCKPQPLPECLSGKVLIPTVNFKNMTLHLNFGPSSLAPLPFRCRMLQDAAQADTESSAVASRPKSAEGKCEVLLPIGLPDEGTFDWLDGFLKKHPDYVELSGRSILEWGLASGVARHRGSSSGRNSNDRPAMDFGIQELDNGTVQQMSRSVAPTLKRNYVVMEVRNNLLASERKSTLDMFDDNFTKVALVVMGEPPEDFQASVHQRLLQEKRDRAACDARRKWTQGERMKVETKEEDGDGEEEKKVEEETLEDAVKKAEEAVELTKEERSVWFRKPTVEDLSKKELSQTFSSFTLPSEEEGFDEVRYVWQPREACESYLEGWVRERKLTQRVEDLQPGAWFKDQWQEWSAILQEWRRRHSNWRDAKERPPLQAPKRRRREESHDEGKQSDQKEEENGDNAQEKERADGAQENGMEAESKEENGKAREEAEPAAQLQAEDLDVFSVRDVCDIGNGEPLFANFTWEDWMLLSLRLEVHLLIHAYKHDMNDPERTSFAEAHLVFYYDKYFRKQLNLKYFGVSTELELLAIINDTVEVMPKSSILEPQLSDDTPMDNFVRLAEDHRRERLRCIDAGDETAALNLQKPMQRSDQTSQQMVSSRGHGYHSRTPPEPPYGSKGHAPTGSSRYGSGGNSTRASSGGYGSGGHGSSRGGPPQSRQYSQATQGSYGSGGSQKRSYPPQSSSGYQPYKQARSGGAPQGRGGSSYGYSDGRGGGSSHGGGYGSDGYRR